MEPNFPVVWMTDTDRDEETHFAGLIWLSSAKVFRSLPAAGGQVENGSGGHVCGFGIMGIIVPTGGGRGAAFGVASRQAVAWGWGFREWFGC